MTVHASAAERRGRMLGRMAHASTPAMDRTTHDTALTLLAAVPDALLVASAARGLVAVVLLAPGTGAALVIGSRQEWRVQPAVVVVVVAVLGALACVRAPTGSHDL